MILGVFGQANCSAQILGNNSAHHDTMTTTCGNHDFVTETQIFLWSVNDQLERREMLPFVCGLCGHEACACHCHGTRTQKGSAYFHSYCQSYRSEDCSCQLGKLIFSSFLNHQATTHSKL